MALSLLRAELPGQTGPGDGGAEGFIRRRVKLYLSLDYVSLPSVSPSLNDGSSFLDRSKVVWGSGTAMMASV